MKPAVCLVCGRSAAAEPAGSKGDWVRFADYQSASSASLGHPTGLEYACYEHIAAAKALVSKNAAEAQAELRAHFGAPPVVSSNQPERASWWQRLFRK
jgi:hypothetical protein